MRKVNRDEEEAATINGCKFFENMRCDAHDDMMNATNKIKHTANTKYMEGVWASVLRSYNTPPLQEDLVPRSRMAPERNGRRGEEVKLNCFLTTE